MAADPRAARNAALRAAARLPPASTVSAKAERLAAELDRYLSVVWPRERGLDALPPTASPLRVELHRIARLTNGAGLRQRRIFDILAGFAQ